MESDSTANHRQARSSTAAELVVGVVVEVVLVLVVEVEVVLVLVLVVVLVLELLPAGGCGG